MKIQIVSDGYPTKEYPLNGVFAFDQAKALKDYGHEILFVSIDLRSIRRKRKFGEYWTSKDNIDIVDYSIPLGNFPNSIMLFFGKFALRRIRKNILTEFGKPDVIHAHFISNGNIAILLKRYFQVPLVLTEHSSSVNKENLSLRTLRLGQKTYTKVNQVICVSQKLSERLEQHWGIKSRVVPNIVDTSLFSYGKHKSDIENKFVFISVGNLNYNKGFDILIKAFKNCEFDSSVILKIIGQGELYNQLNEEIQNLGLSGQIKLLGFMDRDSIAKEMNQSNAFVLASRSETFGVVYIEALASGLPVIGTNCGGPEDYVNEENGILVEINNVDELSEALLTMYRKIDYYDGEEIAKKCKDTFSPDKIATQLTEIYLNTKKEATKQY